MKIITRYVLSELLQTFLITLMGMTLFMIIVGVMREAYSQGLGMKQVLLLLPYVLARSAAVFDSRHGAADGLHGVWTDGLGQ